jgi:uncharacterized protein (DUF1800 family)
MSTSPSDIAHLLKRTSFGASHDRVQQLAAADWDTAIRIVVDKAQAPFFPEIRFRNVYLVSEWEDFVLLINYEMKRLTRPESGLGDRMLWFWHGLLTTSQEKVFFPALMFRQHQLLGRHALGNFRQMLIEITKDPAMLLYLDGVGSYGESPNENYGRELMELFTMGRGNYTQDDVVAAARALAGWDFAYYPSNEGEVFNPDRFQPVFVPDRAYKTSLNYLGKTNVFTMNAVVERILENKATIRYIAKRLLQYFVHPTPSQKSIDQLAFIFRESNFEIRPVLSAMFRHPGFRGPEAKGSRTRQPMESLLAAAGALSSPIESFDYFSYFDATGQFPFYPPNVAGWPLDYRWVGASHSLARTRLGFVAAGLPETNPAIAAILASSDPVEIALQRLLLYEASANTRNALSQAANDIAAPRERAWALLSLAVASPEFALA